MITIAWAYNGPRFPNGQLPSCFPQSCPEIGYFAILGVTGFFLAFWGGLKTILGLLDQGRYLKPKLSPPQLPAPGSSPEIQEILPMGRQLQSLGNRPKWGTIVSLAWSDGQPWYWAGFKPKRLRVPITLVLCADLRGKLESEEWRTLLTYYFWQLKTMSRFFPEVIGLLMGQIISLIVGGLVTSLIFGTTGGALYARFVGGPGSLIALILIFPTVRRLQLRRDRLVARLIGQEALLGVFKKIDQLHLPDIENATNRRGWIARLWPMPNITERIKYLEKN